MILGHDCSMVKDRDSYAGYSARQVTGSAARLDSDPDIRPAEPAPRARS